MRPNLAHVLASMFTGDDLPGQASTDPARWSRVRFIRPDFKKRRNDGDFGFPKAKSTISQQSTALLMAAQSKGYMIFTLTYVSSGIISRPVLFPPPDDT